MNEWLISRCYLLLSVITWKLLIHKWWRNITMIQNSCKIFPTFIIISGSRIIIIRLQVSEYHTYNKWHNSLTKVYHIIGYDTYNTIEHSFFQHLPFFFFFCITLLLCNMLIVQLIKSLQCPVLPCYIFIGPSFILQLWHHIFYHVIL